MKKFLALLLCLTVVFTFAACGGSNAGGGDDTELPTYELNIGTQYYDPVSQPDLNAQGTALQYFADTLKERSDGRITVNINWGSILGSTVDMAEMVSMGTLDMLAGGATGSLDPDVSCFLMPGVMDNMEMARDLYSNPDGGLFLIMKEIYGRHDITLLSSDYGEFRQIQNSKHEVITPDDCNDLLLRMYADDVVNTYWGHIANTTIMAMSEVYTGLQLGTIDGMEFCPQSTVTHGFVDVLKYWTDIYWQWQDSNDIVINTQLFESMSDEDQALIQEVAWEASHYCCDLLDEHWDLALKTMEDGGMQLHFLTDEERKSWTEYGEEVLPELIAMVNEDMYNRIMEVSNEYREAHK